jgi:hypothetical protein
MRGLLRVARDVGWVVVSLVLAVGGIGFATEGGVGHIIVGVLGAAMFLFTAAMRVLMLAHGDRPQTIGPPSSLSDEEHTREWFPDDLPDENLFTPAEIAFLELLRVRAQRLPSGAVWSESLRVRETVVARVAVTETRGHPQLFKLDVSIAAGVVSGDRLHEDRPRATPSPDAFTASGTDDELAERAVRWFEAVLRRPVERAEWWCAGEPYAVRYQFADTGEGLIEAYARKRAPIGLYKRLLAAGHADPRITHVGPRVDTSKLGEPSATVVVRVDGRPLPSPALREFQWYDCGWDREAESVHTGR